MDYFFRQIAPGEVQITKLDLANAPVGYVPRYTVNARLGTCTCPSGATRGTCKHLGMVKRWSGSPWQYFDGERGEWAELPRFAALRAKIVEWGLEEHFRVRYAPATATGTTERG